MQLTYNNSHLSKQLEQWLKPVLYLQLTWVALCILWNVAGVILLSQGLKSPGPTASLIAALVIALIGVGLISSLNRRHTIYLILSILVGIMGYLAVANAFSADPMLWPSDFWRYAGAALNSVGVLSALLAVTGFIRWKSSRVPSKP